MILRSWFVALLAIPAMLSGTDLKPWYPRTCEIQAGISEQLQYFRAIKRPHHSLPYNSFDSFTTLSTELTAFQYSVELETTLAATRRQSFCFDNIRLTGRYQLFDDLNGDWLSVVAGTTLTQSFLNSLRDPSSFHHGILEAEVHLSFGREFSCRNVWLSRWWGLLGFGCGDHGSPWLRGHLEWEHNWLDQQHLALFAETLWGLGGNNFHFPFRGYGSIRHQSVDIGARYTYIFENYARLSVEYSYRPYARNFPENTNRLELKFIYPFWLICLL